MKINNDIYNVGVVDKDIDLFEAQYVVPDGVRYNSYIIVDKYITIMDTVDVNFSTQWLDNIATVLGDNKPTYLVVQHVEPDHSASISALLAVYPDTTVVATAKAHAMIAKFYGVSYTSLTVGEGDVLELGTHKLNFVTAPMVHWPEVMVSYDSTDKVLFSADAFGRFGSCDKLGCVADYDSEARRYYYGIVGKYGMQVKNLLAKASGLDIATVCSLHGAVLTTEIPHVLELYTKWANYQPENDGVMIAYTSVYGNTKLACQKLADTLKAQGREVYLVDIARSSDIHHDIAQAFYYGTLVLATTTYNMDIFPPMSTFVHHLTSRNYCNRKVAVIENGSWAPTAAKVIQGSMANAKGIEWCDTVTISSALDEASTQALANLASQL